MSRKKKHVLRTPLTVKGGIRAQHAPGGNLRVWWSRRWTEVLENFRLGARLGRGRSYAVSGQVNALSIQSGAVVASVQGAHREPYESSIRFRTVEGAAKDRIVRHLRQHPMLIARLLVSDLPFEVEALFREEGMPFFPQKQNDLISRCSCPDYANPCKHLAAVYFLLGEAITKNPLQLLELRGISRQDLLGSAGEMEADPRGAADERMAEQPGVNRPPLTRESFYGAPQAPFTNFGQTVKSVTQAPLIYRLGPLPFWRGQERFVDTLEHLYARAATRGWSVWTGEMLDLRREEEKVIIKGATLQLKHRKMRVDTSWS